jgi:hypothetical protein
MVRVDFDDRSPSCDLADRRPVPESPVDRLEFQQAF